MKRKLLLMGVVLSMILPIGVVGQTWVGGIGYWDVAANWNGGNVPTSSTDVTINSGTVTIRSSGGLAQAKKITVSGGQLIIESGGQLTANDAFSTSGSGTILIKDGGSLINEGFPLPEVTLERNLIGLGKYHYISSPVNAATIGSVFPIAYHNNIWLRTYKESGGIWENKLTSNSMQSNVGYSYYSNVSPVTATFAGVLNTNLDAANEVDLDYAYTGTGDFKGFNLLGNPFACAIDWTKLSREDNVSSTVWVWNSVDGNYDTYTWNGSSGSGDVTNGIIPSCQGFFVRATATGKSITITKASQTHSTTALYKNSIPNELKLQITSNQNDYSDGVFVVFNEHATTGSDLQFDAEKLYGLEEAPQLYTKVLDTKYTTNCLPSIEQISEVPLCLESGIDATFTLKADGMESFNGTNITLTDKKTGYSQKLNSNAEYTFDFTSGEAADRFMLSFEPVGLKEKQELNMGIYTIGNIVKVKFDEANSGTVNITALTGQTVYSEKFSRAANLDLNTQLPEGVYLVTVTTDNKIASRKVFIK